MEFKTIFSMKIAGHLMLKGFVLMDIAENTKFKGKKVFYFKQSDMLEQAMQEYLNNAKVKI